MIPLVRSAMLAATLAAVATVVAAQSTEFTYQGRLQDGALPANGSYDFELRLYLEPAGGTALATIQRPGVAVTNGLFTVPLDFGAQFTGAPRHLEVAARPAGGGAFTTILPRQPLTSTPYAVRSANAGAADALGPACGLCVTDAQIAAVSGAKVTGLVPVAAIPPGSTHYIQNGSSPQAVSNWNISGNGTAGGSLQAATVGAATLYSLAGQTFVSGPGDANVFVGHQAGAANTTGNANTFVGRNAGASNLGGNVNTFVGERAGALNNSGFANTFVGSAAGVSNTTGRTSTFVGVSAGASQTIGADNSFYGVQAGFGTVEGARNSFFGRGAGIANTSGDSSSFFGYEAGTSNRSSGNSFFGALAGRANTIGLFNAFFGYQAGAVNVDGEYNAFFGYGAGAVSTANYNSFFGALAGSSNTTGSSNSFFGDEAGEATTTGGRNTFIGRWAANLNTSGADNTMVGFNVGLLNTTGTDNVFMGLFAGASNTTGHHNTVIGSDADVGSGALQYATAIGGDVTVNTSNTVAIGRNIDVVRVDGTLSVGTLGGGAATAVCRGGSGALSTCSSARRYKTDIASSRRGLDVVARLRPVTFQWKTDGSRDLGFVAEEVDAVEPLLATHDDAGRIEGVKYGQVSAVLVRAVQEQQQQIETQRRTIEALRALVCGDHPDAAVCAESRP